MIELPDKRKCFNLSEQVAQNLRNITFLAEEYKNIDSLPVIWQTYKEEFDSEFETFEGWEGTFEGWTTTLETYLANMSSAAVSAIANQDIAPKTVNQTNPNNSFNNEMATTVTGLTLTNIYSRIIVVNGFMYFITNFKLHNGSGNTVTISADTSMAFNNTSLPDALASKIYDLAGNTVHDSLSDAVKICGACGYASKNLNTNNFEYKVYISLANSNSSNAMRTHVKAEEAISIADNEDLYVTARIFLSLF